MARVELEAETGRAPAPVAIHAHLRHLDIGDSSNMVIYARIPSGAEHFTGG